MNKKYHVFDFDGTILDSNKIFKDLCIGYMKRCKVPVNYLFFKEAETMDFDHFCNALRFVGGNIDSYISVKNYISENITKYYATCKLKPGVERYLKLLSHEGYSMCIASATDGEYIYPVLRRLCVEKYFDFVSTVSQVGGVGKDKPDLLISITKKYRTDNYKEFIVYDDALGAIRSANAIGMNTVGVYDDETKYNWMDMQKEAQYIISSFTNPRRILNMIRREE